MNANYLFPNRFKKIGWLLLIPGILLGIVFLFLNGEIEFLNITVFSIVGHPLLDQPTYFTFIENNILDEIAGLLIIIGALLIAFSKEKYEDEFIARVRLESLVWATYLNYIILILTIIFVYDMAFFWVLVFNMFTILLFFVIRFNWALSQSKNQLQDEE